MAKSDGLPEILFVGRRAKERYKLTVFKVLDRDVDGVPTLCRMIKDDETVALVTGDAFITGYVPAVILEPKK